MIKIGADQLETDQMVVRFRANVDKYSVEYDDDDDDDDDKEEDEEQTG